MEEFEVYYEPVLTDPAEFTMQLKMWTMGLFLGEKDYHVDPETGLLQGKKASLACYILQLSSSMFGFSGFLWFHKHEKLSRTGMGVCTIPQLIPCIDLLGSIVCYFMLHKED